MQLMESHLAALMLWRTVWQRDAIHVPSRFAVAVTMNKLGLSVNTNDRMDACVLS